MATESMLAKWKTISGMASASISGLTKNSTREAGSMANKKAWESSKILPAINIKGFGKMASTMEKVNKPGPLTANGKETNLRACLKMVFGMAMENIPTS